MKQEGEKIKQAWMFSYTHHNGKIAVLVELTTNSDFALKTDEFQELGKNLCLQVAAHGSEDLEGQKFVKDETILVSDLIAGVGKQLKEKVSLGRVRRIG